MEKIREVIVVEGQNDINKIQSCLDVDVIQTHGTHLSKTFLNHLKVLQKERGLIIMTDDDYPGRWIRTQISEVVGPTKHAFIDKKDSKTAKKVGIEHASCESIKIALSNVITFMESQESISRSFFIDCNLQGHSDSATKRKELLKKLGLPMMNAKRLYKTLNMMNISEEELKVLLKEEIK